MKGAGGYVRMPHALCSSSSGVNGTWTNTPEGISSPTLTDAIFTVASKWWWRVVGVDGRRWKEAQGEREGRGIQQCLSKPVLYIRDLGEQMERSGFCDVDVDGWGGT